MDGTADLEIQIVRYCLSQEKGQAVQKAFALIFSFFQSRKSFKCCKIRVLPFYILRLTYIIDDNHTVCIHNAIKLPSLLPFRLS